MEPPCRKNLPPTFAKRMRYGYTVDAKEECLNRKMGLYNAKELSGGLWRRDYWAYSRKDEDGNPEFAYKTARS